MAATPVQNSWFLTGPTASGKSAVGVELARRIGAEIVSLDSIAVYRGMDIGTAKPTPQQRREVPHHLIDVLDPWRGIQPGPVHRGRRAESRRKSPAADGRCCSSAERRST